MISGKHIADTARTTKLIGTPYSKLDCQALVEEILKDAGLHIINFRGSNHMFRDLVYSRSAVISDAPPGSLAFIVRRDGGEKKRGYSDDLGNACHVAIVINDSTVLESTTGGVQYGRKSRFTHFGLIKDVDYSEGGETDGDTGTTTTISTMETIKRLVSVLRDNLDELEVFLNDIHRGS